MRDVFYFLLVLACPLMMVWMMRGGRGHGAGRDTIGGYMRKEPTLSEITYRVPDMSCAHCEHAVSSELRAVAGVDSVDVDLETKVVVVRGAPLDDAVLRAAIEEAGYEAA
jgi:copper chaperone